MSIKALCPGCNTSYTLADTLRGKKIRCKKCQEVFVAEEAAPEDEEASAEPEEAEAAEDRPARGRTAITDRRRTRDEEDEAPATRRRAGEDEEEEDEDDRPARRRAGR